MRSTETWLNSGIVCGELLDDKYVVYRRDRVCASKHRRMNNRPGKFSKLDSGEVMIAV